MDYVFLPLIIFFGLATSWEDFKSGKIRNIWIFSGFILGAFFWLGLFFISPTVDAIYLSRLALNLFCALAVGFFMWKLKAWSAGDAKMLMLYSFLIPLSFYSNSYLVAFPSFIIIFNTFLILLLYLLLRSSFFGLKLFLSGRIALNLKNNSENAKNYFRGLARFLPGFLLFMITISWSYEYFQNYIKLNFFLYQIIAVTALIIFQAPLIRLFQKKYTNKIAFVLFLALFGAGLYLDYAFTFASMSNVFLMIFLFMVLFPIFHKIINFHLDQANKKEIDINSLEAGMMIAPESAALLGISHEPEGKFALSRGEAIETREKAGAKNLKSIFITQPFYFAIWLFAGVIATLLAKGSLLSWVLGL